MFLILQKKILSASKSAKDNNVHFEFHANHCFVKTQDTKQIVLQEQVKDELCFYLFSSKHQLFCI